MDSGGNDRSCSAGNRQQCKGRKEKERLEKERHTAAIAKEGLMLKGLLGREEKQRAYVRERMWRWGRSPPEERERASERPCLTSALAGSCWCLGGRDPPGAHTRPITPRPVPFQTFWRSTSGADRYKPLRSIFGVATTRALWLQRPGLELVFVTRLLYYSRGRVPDRHAISLSGRLCYHYYGPFARAPRYIRMTNLGSWSTPGTQSIETTSYSA